MRKKTTQEENLNETNAAQEQIGAKTTKKDDEIPPELAAFIDPFDYGSSTDEYFATFLNTAEKALARHKGTTRLVPITRSKYPNLAYDAVAVVNGALDNHVSFHILLLEATGERIARVDKIDLPGLMGQGQQRTIPTFANKAVDQVMLRIALKEVIALGVKHTNQVYGSGFVVVPQELDPADEQAVGGLLTTAHHANLGKLIRFVKGASEMRLQKFKQNNRVLRVFTTFERKVLMDATRQPNRADIVTIVARNVKSAEGDTINNRDQNRHLGQTAGFIDLLPVKNTAVSPYMPIDPMSRRHMFGANFVFTHLSGEIITIEDVLRYIGLTAGSLNSGSMGGGLPLWANYFRPVARTGKNKSLDLTNFGAINYEGRVGIDPTKGELWGAPFDFSDQKMAAQFDQLFSLLVNPNLGFSIDIVDGRPMSWMTEPLHKPGSRETLIKAAQRVTTEGFKDALGERPVILPNESIVPMGHYTADGIVRDIRDLDYLAVANFYGPSKPEKISQWVSACLMSDPASVAMRMEMIEEMTRGSVTFTGYARRVTFSGAFISALTANLTASGLQIIQENNQTVQQQYGAAYADFLNLALAQGGNYFSQANTAGGYNGYTPWSF